MRRSGGGRQEVRVQLGGCSQAGAFPPPPTLAILLLLSAVRKDMLLISFCTTKFCSSRLKFCRGGGHGTEQSPAWDPLQAPWTPQPPAPPLHQCPHVPHVSSAPQLTWDLDQ